MKNADLYRTAGRIDEQLQRVRRSALPAELPAAAWEQCRRLAAQLDHAQARGWQAAAQQRRDDLRRALQGLRWQLDVADQELDEPVPRRRESLREIYADLAALDGEFPRVEIDLRQQTVRVTTHPVELQGLSFGPFEVELEYLRLGAAGGCYTVRAVDPWEAAGDDAVTHPHVRDDRLCEGEASAALRAALADGRILDFFSVVAQTLATYNRDSAYVPLARWTGSVCSDCGDADDDLGVCQRCQSDVCSNCWRRCGDCAQLACHDCSDHCAACHDAHCGDCLTACRLCSRTCCKGCLDDEACPDCRSADEVRPAVADPAVLPVRLGEAPLPA